VVSGTFTEAGAQEGAASDPAHPLPRGSALEDAAEQVQGEQDEDDDDQDRDD
jgi:hypothetical protein